MRPKKAYMDQVSHAKERKIPWLMSYADWLELWLLSGKWFSRGKCKEQYQMCRKGDTGAYSTRNCFIGTVAENQKDRHKISDAETKNIIEEYKYTMVPQWKLGQKYSLSQSAISRIVNKKRRGV